MSDKELKFFRAFFIVAALWNLTGAIFGYFNTAYTFQGLFDRELSDSLFYAVYKGAWGTTLVYFIGYLIVARDPIKHTGIVIVGGIGKVAYAMKLLEFYLTDVANSKVLIIVIGDFLFTVLFIYYFYRLIKLKIRII